MRQLLVILFFIPFNLSAQTFNNIDREPIIITPLDPVEEPVVIEDISRIVAEAFNNHDNIKELQSADDSPLDSDIIESYVDQILSNKTEGDLNSEETLEEYGYNSEIAEDSIGVEIKALSESARQARINAIDKAIEFAVTEYTKSIMFSLEGYSIEDISNKFVSKVLIIDEEYNYETLEYIGYFDVWLNTELLNEVAVGFEDEDFNVDGPEWVLVFPSEKVDEIGNWSISKKNSAWSNVWKIPTESNKTQFVKTNADIDDINEITNHQSIETYSEFIADKYNAPAVIYAFFDDVDTINLIYWDNQLKILKTKTSYIVQTGENVDPKLIAKNSIINEFWSLYSEIVPVEDEELSFQDANVVGIEYKIIGQAVVGENYTSASVLIPLTNIDILDVEKAIVGLNGISVKFMERDANSVVLDITMKTVFDIYEFTSIMSQLGFVLVQ